MSEFLGLNWRAVFGDAAGSLQLSLEKVGAAAIAPDTKLAEEQAALPSITREVRRVEVQTGDVVGVPGWPDRIGICEEMTPRPLAHAVRSRGINEEFQFR